MLSDRDGQPDFGPIFIKVRLEAWSEKRPG